MSARPASSHPRYGPQPVRTARTCSVKPGRYLSPLRYPGGKQRLGAYFESLISAKYPKPPIYVEPFAGGAGVALHLLAAECVSAVHLNDLDRSVYSFWHSALNHPEQLCELIQRRRVSVAEWDRQKDIQRHKHDAPLLDLGYSTLFLNRTNRSGILRGGIIGGRAQAGPWKLNARFDKASVIERIRFVASFAKKISISNYDCRDVDDLRFGRTGKPFIYFDPPYFEKGRDLYLNHFAPFDHEALSKRIARIRAASWAVTYDDVVQVRKMFSGFRSQRYALSYTADKFRKGMERLFLSANLA
jgi:DNA adenine methylase